ncbi:sensor histidine kinase [Pseudoroseicyclus sp. CXY001]|uniref:sensor histidine kinase n=1 Tax=Pseudoroseicyclus sp. CXY001 TaxID=3242492 RepID=UPI0035711E4F
MLARAHPQQGDRLSVLEAYDILDTEAEEEFDALTRIAATVCGAPTALVSLVAEDRQWFKARLGCALEETGLESSICSHAILGEGILEVPDTQADPRTADNPLCQGEGAFRFYAGAPIVDTATGLPLGTLCVLDLVPRELTEDQRQVLLDLAGQAMRLIELRRAVADRELASRETDHRIKNSLQSVAAHIRLQRRMLDDSEAAAKDALGATEQRLSAIAALHEALAYSGSADEVDLPAYLARILDLSLHEAPANVRQEVSLDPCTVDGRTAAALGTLVHEMSVNAMRHAFPDGREGRVILTGRALPGGGYDLACGDDGIGLGEGEEPADETTAPVLGTRRGGLGLAIIESMLQQLGATSARPVTGPEGGTILSFTLPAPVEDEALADTGAPEPRPAEPGREAARAAEAIVRSGAAWLATAEGLGAPDGTGPAGGPSKAVA